MTAVSSASTTKVAPPVRRAALVFIFFTVMLDMLAFGVIIPVLPQLIEGFLGGDVGRAALWVGLFGTVFALGQFVFAPVQGALSDRFGRRPVILISCLGLGLDFILLAVVNTLPLLMIGRIIAGITSASVSTAHAYIADTTAPEKRAAAFGLLGAAFGLGFILGPALGGFLGEISLRAPFWAAATLVLANFCYGLFVLPESLPPERRAARFDARRANPLGGIALLRSRPGLMGLALVQITSQLAHYVLPAVYVLYVGSRYGWSSQTIGLVLAAVGVCSVIVQAGLVRVLVPRIGERRAMLIGLVCGAAGFIIYGLAPTGAVFVAGIPIMALWGMVSPSVQSLATRRVDLGHQGRLQGALTSLGSLAGVFGPAMFAAVFAFFISDFAPIHLPGAAFLLAGALLLAGAVLAERVTR